MKQKPFYFTSITSDIVTGSEYTRRRAVDAFDWPEAQAMIKDLGYDPEVRNGELVFVKRRY